MYNEMFAERLSKLRINKGVSARNMSLSLGQSADYINRIESSKAFPSMQAFFNICEYLEITPSDFFNMELSSPKSVNDMIGSIDKLDEDTRKLLLELIKKL
jgi:Predicted transcriptional regulators